MANKKGLEKIGWGEGEMVTASFLNDSTKRNYWQSYTGRLKQLGKN